MQFVLNKLGVSNYKFSTHAQKAQAYSPFSHHIKDIQDKRSRLFPDRRRVPGRKTKYILAICYVIHVYALMKLAQAKKIYGHKADQQRNLQRKSAPFFQSITDVEFTIQKHRFELMARQVWDQDQLTKPIFHNNITWIPNRGTPHMWGGFGMGRYVEDISTSIKNRYLSGYNIQNV